MNNKFNKFLVGIGHKNAAKGIGVSLAAVKKWSAGKRNPRIDLAYKIISFSQKFIEII